MGQIDVTDLLADPDFVDKMAIITRTPLIDSFGQNKVQETSVSTYGSVQPASGKVLQRLPDALRDVNLKSFWVKGNITATDPGKYSSILVFKGQRYQVQTVMDWTNFGQGWCEGTCVAEKPS